MLFREIIAVYSESHTAVAIISLNSTNKMIFVIEISIFFDVGI
jgi:hypothetical protein